ncbi:VanZ family protein [Deinococcus arboris]|uniref:VanZ family protein n=1 Tax=Deinococcus arboris TaxID=2682977 RepID=UPI003F6F8999
MTRRARPLWWGPALALMAAIWYFSAQPQTPGPRLVHPLDWGVHFLVYLALGFALGRATGRPGLAWVLAAWFGALDEVHQAFVPPREAGVTDWLFDTAGAWLGSWAGAGREEAGTDEPDA